jgi:hypothetical protein
MIDVIASAPHYRAHLAPIVDALPYDMLGNLKLAGVTLVASHRDLETARKRGAQRIVLAQHGAGQSYGGDPKSARNPSYPGGDNNDDVGLFLVPNRHAAQRWIARYPGASVRVVGSPRLDTVPCKTLDPLDDHPVVAVSFHWDPYISPEARSAFGWYRSVVVELSKRYKLLGHGHPKRFDLPKWYSRNHIEHVADFDEVCRRADVYVCDNSSTMFEFAATGRPVVVLNAPWYRRDIDHGLRFWEGAHLGVNVDRPGDLVDGVTEALRDSWGPAREAVVDHVYAYRSGAGERAARAIMEWAS